MTVQFAILPISGNDDSMIFSNDNNSKNDIDIEYNDVINESLRALSDLDIETAINKTLNLN